MAKPTAKLKDAASSPAPDETPVTLTHGELRELHSEVLRLRAKAMASEAKAAYCAALDAQFHEMRRANLQLTAALDAIMAGGGE